MKIVIKTRNETLFNDKQIYEELKRDPTPALKRKLNSKILTLKKTDAIDTRRYYRLRCSVPQPPKLYKPGILNVSTVQVLDDHTTTSY